LHELRITVKKPIYILILYFNSADIYLLKEETDQMQMQFATV